MSELGYDPGQAGSTGQVLNHYNLLPLDGSVEGMLGWRRHRRYPSTEKKGASNMSLGGLDDFIKRFCLVNILQ